MKQSQNSIFYLFIGIAIVLLSAGCKKEHHSVNLAATNRWILDSMKVYYYWKDQLPAAPQDQASAGTFFKSLLNPADRFSFLVDPGEQKQEYSSFAWYGFEYALLENKSRPDELLGTVTLVVPDGPADRKGLKRGDIFTSVNGRPLSQANTAEITKALKLGDGIQLSIAHMISGELVAAGNVNLRYERHNELPVYLTKVFSDKGQKTGYIFYNQFSGNFDYQVLEALRSLRDQGITELVLDLRYNPGGDVSTAAKIAGTLSPATADQTFVIYEGNSKAGRRASSFQKTMKENAFEPQLFNDLLNYRLSLNRIIVLTSSSTASAAELLINNLKPYTQVIQIGGTTMGKDMASFAISDFRNPKQVDIVLHPLIFKLYNAQNAGNYARGLKPDYEVNEFSELPLRAFGDPEDPLLKKALEISGSRPVLTMQLQKRSVAAGSLRYQSAVSRNEEHAGIEVSKRTVPQL